jgi:hypothetical protein
MDCLSDKPRSDAPGKLDEAAAQRLRHWARDQPLSAPEMLQRHTDDGARHLGKSDGVLRECAQVKYAFINRYRQVWPISVQCQVLDTSVAGYHKHFVGCASASQRRYMSDDALLVHIKVIN